LPRSRQASNCKKFATQHCVRALTLNPAPPGGGTANPLILLTFSRCNQALVMQRVTLTTAFLNIVLRCAQYRARMRTINSMLMARDSQAIVGVMFARLRATPS